MTLFQAALYLHRCFPRLFAIDPPCVAGCRRWFARILAVSEMRAGYSGS